MPPDEPRDQDPARDVLAAEEFGMPAPDPTLEPAHDVLAAEEFGMPARDPALRHGPVALPADPTGIAEPHDVLAAEEFAMPAPHDGRGDASHAEASASGRARKVLGAAALVMLAARVLRRRRA